MRRTVAVFASAVIGLGGLVVSAPPASAGLLCSVSALCSHTYNSSSSGGRVLAARNWCGSGFVKNQNVPPCGSGSQVRELNPGMRTGQYQDWDAFRVTPGCLFEWRLNGDARRDDLRNSSTSRWIRIRDHQTAYIDRITC